ncbi:MAG: cytochrome P450, partial [Actinomycetes bacterium]
PNPHVSFGVGNHFCLGAALARMEAEVLLRGLRERVDTFQLAGQVERTPSSIISGIRHAKLHLNSK